MTKKQTDKFKAMAKELEADEDENTFEDKPKKIVNKDK